MFSNCPKRLTEILAAEAADFGRITQKGEGNVSKKTNFYYGMLRIYNQIYNIVYVRSKVRRTELTFMIHMISFFRGLSFIPHKLIYYKFSSSKLEKKLKIIKG